MPPKKSMPIWDKRMFELMDFVISNKIKGIDGDDNFINAIGMKSITALYQIKYVKQSFRHKHFFNASKFFDVSMDWFYGFSDSMKRIDDKITAEELLMQALLKLKNKGKNK